MASFVAWMDYSERERRDVLDVIDLFRDQDTRDELGIGTVRDAFSDMLFPGTSTIQTRARYFLFIPWIYQDLEWRTAPAHQVDKRARRQEVKLIDALAASSDPNGVIGIEARAKVNRLPSDVYWQGLGRWGIRLFAGSKDQYHKSIGFKHSAGARARRFRQGDEGDDDGAVDAPQPNWHLGIPPALPDLPHRASFDLTQEEAEYLRDRILNRATGTALAFLVARGRLAGNVPFLWEHPQIGEMPQRLQEQLTHARNFSETFHGAALLYNYLLAELVDVEEKIEDFKVRLDTWMDGLRARSDALVRWDRHRYWSSVLTADPRIPIPTRHFVDSWLELVDAALRGRRGASHFLHDRSPARTLIQRRERDLKGPQARLENKNALLLWSGEAGTRQLSYRWPVVQDIVRDVLEGLAGAGLGEGERLHA